MGDACRTHADDEVRHETLVKYQDQVSAANVVHLIHDADAHSTRVYGRDMTWRGTLEEPLRLVGGGQVKASVVLSLISSKWNTLDPIFEVLSHLEQAAISPDGAMRQPAPGHRVADGTHFQRE